MHLKILPDLAFFAMLIEYQQNILIVKNNSKWKIGFFINNRWQHTSTILNQSAFLLIRNSRFPSKSYLSHSKDFMGVEKTVRKTKKTSRGIASALCLRGLIACDRTIISQMNKYYCGWDNLTWNWVKCIWFVIDDKLP